MPLPFTKPWVEAWRPLWKITVPIALLGLLAGYLWGGGFWAVLVGGTVGMAIGIEIASRRLPPAAHSN